LVLEGREDLSLDVKRGVYYGNSVVLPSFQFSCKYHERIEMAMSHEREHDKVSLFSSISHGNNYQEGKEGMESKGESRELWLGIGNAWSYPFICKLLTRRCKEAKFPTAKRTSLL
jgi:hypothetical protein